MLHIRVDNLTQSCGMTGLTKAKHRQGAIYCATGSTCYLEAALISAIAFRQLNPEVPVTLLCDTPLRQSLLSKYGIELSPITIRNDFGFGSRFTKTQLNELSPYAETLYLDADILPLKPITAIWNYLETSEIAFVLDRNPTIGQCDHISIEEIKYTLQLLSASTWQYNSGLILWRKTLATTKLFEKWNNEWQRFSQHDQLALVRALSQSCLKISLLPKHYNISPFDASQCSMPDQSVTGLHCWGGKVDTGIFREIAQHYYPNIPGIVAGILANIPSTYADRVLQQSFDKQEIQITYAPEVSLICTVYNREKYLAQAIESVLTQTYQSWEIIIWDDGSTDNSLKIALSYSAKDSRIRVIKAQHQGRAKALKAAHNEAIGNYIGWIDSDDALAPEALAYTVDFLNKVQTVGMVYTNYQTMDESGIVGELGRRCCVPYSVFGMLTDFMTFHFRLIRRALFDAVGGIDQSFLSAEDYDLCLRLSEITQVHHIRVPLYYYRVHSESISVNDRTTQIAWAEEAVNRAISRRRLSDQITLNVDSFGQFSIRHKM
jgi:GT2 family glycosyltransferase